MAGYFEIGSPDRNELHKRNQERYPNLAALDLKVSKMLATEEAQGWDVPRREVEICKIHPIYWMEKYGFIRAGVLDGGAEEVGIIPFKLNTTQLQVSNRICKAFLVKPWGRVQAIVLKHRKAGVSTLAAAYDYWICRFTRNLNGFVIADLGSHTDNIISMIDLFHQRDECGAGLEPKFRPPQKRPMSKNKKGLKWSNESMVEQDSGENSNPGTSGTINLVHMSENSKWRDPENAETSLLNSIPRKGFVFVIKESTAFGQNKYAKDCDSAEKGQSNWDFIFISWKDLPDCEYEMELGEELIYTEREAELVAAYKLRPGHIKFRRSQIGLLESEEKFKQDFPLNSKEPFLITGTNFFNAALIQERVMEIKFFRDWKLKGMEYVEEKYPEIVQKAKHHPRGMREALCIIEDRNVTPLTRGFTANRGKVTLLPEKTTPSPEDATIYHLPFRDRKYLVTIDVAEGRRSDEYTSDNSIVMVFDVERREQVAEWGGVFDEEVTAVYGVMLARFYNNADIAPEMNNRCGALLETELKRTGYKKFFHRQRVSNQQVTREFGWSTTVGNKKEVCGQFRLDFKNGDCFIHSLPLLEEMLYFVDTKGRLEASSGTDDRVMAASVNVKVIHDTPAYRQSSQGFSSPRSQGRQPTTSPTSSYAQHTLKKKQKEVLRRYA